MTATVAAVPTAPPAPKVPKEPKAPKPPKEPKAPKAPKGKAGFKGAAGKGNGAAGKGKGKLGGAPRPPDPDVDPWAPSPWRRRLLVTAIFVVAEMVMIRRTPGQLAHSLLGNLGNPALAIWTLRWDGHALIQSAALHHPSSVFNANIFWPFHHTLAYADDLLSIAPFYNVLFAVTHNWTLSFNLLWLGELGLNMGATYSLTRWLTQRTEAAVFAGLAAGFSGFVWSQIGQPPLQLLGLIPLGLLLLFKLLRRPSIGLGVGLGVVNVVILLAAQYWAAMYVVAVIVVLIGWLIAARGKLTKGLVMALLVAGGITLMAVPTLIPYREVDQAQGKRPLQPVYSLHGRDLVRAAPGSYLYGSLANDDAPGAGERHLFPGFSTMALAAAGAVALSLSYRRSRAQRRAAALQAPREESPDPDDNARPTPAWSTSLAPNERRGSTDPPPSAHGMAYTRVSAAPAKRPPPDRRRYIVLLMAVGVAAGTLAVGSPDGLWTPWRVLYRYLPGFAGIQVTARLAGVTTVAVAVLAGVGLDALLNRLPRPWLRMAVTALACIVVLAELAAPLPWTTLPSDAATLAVYHALAHDPAGTVVELPMADPSTQPGIWSSTEPARMVWSTIDWHPRLNGYSDDVAPMYANEAAVLATLPSPAAQATLRAQHVRYLIVHVGRQAGTQMFTAAEAGTILGSLPAGATTRRYGPNYLVDLGSQ